MLLQINKPDVIVSEIYCEEFPNSAKTSQQGTKEKSVDMLVSCFCNISSTQLLKCKNNLLKICHFS